jgi:hypothetical protein
LAEELLALQITDGDNVAIDAEKKKKIVELLRKGGARTSLDIF